MQVTVTGLRGGVGTSSIAAMLADALTLMGESVLLIDLNPSDLLRLHFNIPYADKHGWAFGEANGSGWKQHIFQIKEKLHVLPYGRHGLASMGLDLDTPMSVPSVWCHKKSAAASGAAWIIFDTTQTSAAFASLYATSDLHLLVAQADMASHILLGQHHLADKTKIVVNRLDAKQRLSDAVLLDWNIRYAAYLTPVSVRQDLHVQEAFAHKMPATTYFPDSSSAQDVLSLATWCLVQRGALR